MISVDAMIITGLIVTLIITFSIIKHLVRPGPTITKENGYLLNPYSDDDSFSSNFSSDSDNYWLYNNEINNNKFGFDDSEYSTTDSDYDWTMDPGHSYSICNVYHISDPNNDWL